MMLARWSDRDASWLASLRLFITLKNPVATCFCSSVRLLSHKVNSYKILETYFLLRIITTNEKMENKHQTYVCRYRFIHIGRIEISTRWFSHRKCCSIFKTFPASNGFCCFRNQLNSWIRRSQECFIFIKRRPADVKRNINLLDWSLLIVMRFNTPDTIS